MAKMTDSEVTAVVRASNMPTEDQDILLKRALDGDPSARFMVAGLKSRQGKVWDSTVGTYGGWVKA